MFYNDSSLLFFWIIDLYFLIPPVVTQTVIVAAKLAIPKGTPNNEANAEIETQPVTIEAKISECST